MLLMTTVPGFDCRAAIIENLSISGASSRPALDVDVDELFADANAVALRLNPAPGTWLQLLAHDAAPCFSSAEEMALEGS